MLVGLASDSISTVKLVALRSERQKYPVQFCCEKGILAIMYLSSKLRGLHTHNTYSLSKQDSMYNSNNLIIKYEVTTVLHKFIYTYNI